jgi:hypothetical protein
MDFIFTVSIKGLGIRDVAEENAMALLDAFEKVHPEAGPAVGADLVTGRLEVTFSAAAPSYEGATAKAQQIFDDAASTSRLDPIEVVGFELDAEPTEQALAS